jgi:hypothetical protein
MRAVFVLTTVVLALALGIVAAASDSPLLIRALIVGFVPMMWAVSHAIERLAAGRDVWHFTAPYPYRWMPHRPDTAPPRPSSGRRAVEVRHETEDRATLPLAASAVTTTR